MQPSVSPTPPAISANIHANALRRVTRMFTATLGDIFAELFQNARRAGATRIRVTLTRHVAQTGHTVIVDDDGAGVVSPDVLLSFATNGWSEDLVRREDAAGMGLLSLARRGCSISSRRSVDHDNPWRVDRKRCECTTLVFSLTPGRSSRAGVRGSGIEDDRRRSSPACS